MFRKFSVAIFILQLAWAIQVADGCRRATSGNVSTHGMYSPTIENNKYCSQCNHGKGNSSLINREYTANNTTHSKGTKGKLTKCNRNLYLKTESGVTSCVAGEDCGSGSFPTVDSAGNKKCIPCNDSANGGIEHCSECSLLAPTSRSATTLIKCSKCSVNMLSPLGDGCLRECPAGTYDSSDVCALCHESCASCNNNAEPTSCTTCYSGFVLSHTNGPIGKCIPECTGEYIENCDDGQCTAIVGTSTYCSKCKTGYVPVDGICVSVTTREVTECIPNNDGTCKSCKGTYFLQSGGCYQSTTYPGMTLCEKAQDGKCITCTNSQKPDAQGSCPLCELGCELCSASKATTCWTCFPGYYQSGTKCFKCTDNSNEGGRTITGVPNCLSCEPPDNGSGPVTCYVTQQSDKNNSRDSLNKNALSSGAITGISVVAILIIGGVVGFLCWWFLCHKKK
ncbi:High cysteine protein [Giardia lamblia P15]|uniref:High cysteine protein n=1 Tax=Giardia intestinalis (strain P15) TaxID=658858 RepID=E1F7B5_GIAIA|nr:High cysteine protein [Giardia lamblia P15]